jgi:hypothetical protein
MSTPDTRITGKASYLLYKGTRLRITKYSPKMTKTHADMTDSGDYDAASDMLWETQKAVKLAASVDVEGNYNLSETPATVIADLYSDVGAVPVVFGLTPGALYGHGLYDVTDFSTDVPVSDKVTWSATLKLNGIFTPNA